MIDNEALVTATTALAKIESHEQVCAQRWGFVQKLLMALLTQLIAVLGLLIWAVFGPL